MKAGYRWVIPCEELRPLVEEWARRNEYEQRPSYEAVAGGQRGHAPKVTIGEVLSHRSGLPRRRIAGILNGNNGTPNVSFDTADKLLCAMDMVDEWHGRLASYYEEPIEVSTAEARRLNEKERLMKDNRDPQVVGQTLLEQAPLVRSTCGDNIELSDVYDVHVQHFPIEDWTGDGFMSSNPAEHHSMTSQVGNERISVAK